MSKKKLNSDNVRPEQEIFDDLANLCSAPGYIHVIAYFCHRDHFIRYTDDEITEDNITNLYSLERLVRTEISTLIGLMVKHPVDISLPEPADFQCLIKKTEDLLRELHCALVKPMMDQAKEQLVKGKPTSSFYDAAVMREPIFYGGDSAYDFQYAQLAVQKYENDKEWLNNNKGFNIDDARKISEALASLLNNGFPEITKSFANTSPEKWTVLPAFTFTKDELANASGVCEAKIEGFLETFCFDIDSRNETFSSLNEFNATNAAPILKISETKYVLLQYYSLFESIYESPFFWMCEDEDYKSIAFNNRGKFTENFISDCLIKIFGRDQVFSNVDIYKGRNRFAEADVLVLYGDSAIVVQAKSKRLTLEARKGNDQALQRDFGKAIQDAANQGLKCAKTLTGDDFCFILSSGEEFKQKPQPRNIYSICALSDHYPALAAHAKGFLEFESTKIIHPPLVLDVFTIDVMVEMLDTPLQFLSYLSLRALFDDKLHVGHELSTLGLHLNQNLWLDNEFDMAHLADDSSASIDVAMMARRIGAPGEKTPKGILTRYKNTNIGFLLEQIEQLKYPFLTGLGLLFLQANSEAAMNINNGFVKTVNGVQRDGGPHDFSLSFGSSKSGFTMHSSRLSEIESQERLLRHCKLRKYDTKSDVWYGIIIDPDTREIVWATLCESDWKNNLQMELALQDLKKRSAPQFSIPNKRPKKVGRNEMCPCGSGKKYKKCCLQGYAYR